MPKAAEVIVLTSIGVVYSVVGLALFLSGRKETKQDTTKKISSSPAVVPAQPPPTYQMPKQGAFPPQRTQQRVKCNSTNYKDLKLMIGPDDSKEIEFDSLNKLLMYIRFLYLAGSSSDDISTKRNKKLEEILDAENVAKLKSILSTSEGTFPKYNQQKFKIMFLVLFLWYFNNKQKLLFALNKSTPKFSDCVLEIPERASEDFRIWWSKNKFRELDYFENVFNELKTKEREFWTNNEELTEYNNKIIQYE